jgi:hypothetical protein
MVTKANSIGFLLVSSLTLPASEPKFDWAVAIAEMPIKAASNKYILLM